MFDHLTRANAAKIRPKSEEKKNARSTGTLKIERSKLPGEDCGWSGRTPGLPVKVVGCSPSAAKLVK